jgi:mitochondrial protein import protein ZIM17
MTIEDLMREQGQLVKKGTLSEDGDLEFWEDGSTTNRRKEKGAQPAAKEGRARSRESNDAPGATPTTI